MIYMYDGYFFVSPVFVINIQQNICWNIAKKRKILLCSKIRFKKNIKYLIWWMRIFCCKKNPLVVVRHRNLCLAVCVFVIIFQTFFRSCNQNYISMFYVIKKQFKPKKSLSLSVQCVNISVQIIFGSKCCNSIMLSK